MFSSKLFYSLLIIAVLVVLVLIDETLVNTLLSVVTLILAGACYCLGYYLWIKRKESVQHAAIKLRSRIMAALFLASLSVFFLFLSYDFLFFEPFAIVCRYGSCVFGPYGWAAALLSFAGALLFLVLCYLLVSPFKDSYKN